MSFFSLLLVALFGWLLWLAIKKYFGGGGPAQAPSAHHDAPAFHWPNPGDSEVDIVGESHHREAIARAIGHTGDAHAHAEVQAALVPNDDNPHDPKAVAVYIGAAQVGYLSREEARSFRRRLGAKKLTGMTTSCDAVVGYGGLVKGRRFDYKVTLLIKDFG